MKSGTLRHDRLIATSDRKILYDIINDQIRAIDATILSAHIAGFNQIEHVLPTCFNTSNMSNSDAQLFVFSEIVDLYKKPESAGGKGFVDTTITLSERPFLRIRWSNGIDAKERASRVRILNAAVTKK